MLIPADRRHRSARHTFIVTVTCLAAWLLVTPEARAQSAARIDTVTPASGRAGDQISITGIGFGAFGVKVTVGGIPAEILAANGHTIAFRVPAGVRSGVTEVVATNPGGHAGRIRFTVLAPIVPPITSTPETARAASAMVTRDGDQIAATSSNGTTYTLRIPFGAFSTPTTITVTPLVDVAHFPLSGPILGAVRLEPAGLHFDRPVALTVTLPAPAAPGGLLALHQSDGGNFEAPPITIAGTTITSMLTHFSNHYVTRPTAEEYAQMIVDMLNGLPAAPSVSVLRTLIEFVDLGLVTYGQENPESFCSLGPDVCKKVYDKAIDGLGKNLTDTCLHVQTLITGKNPYAAYDLLASVVGLSASLAQVQNAAEGLQLPDVRTTVPGLQCVVEALGGIVSLAQAEGLDNALLTVVGSEPPEPLVTQPLQLLQRVYGDAGSLDVLKVQQQVVSAISGVLQKILNEAVPRCAGEPLQMDAILFRVKQIFSAGELNAFGDLNEPFVNAAAGCRVRLDPEDPAVAPEHTVQFSARLIDPDGERTEFNWEVAEGECGSIDPTTGLFTAGKNEGECLVRATFPESRVIGVEHRFFSKTARVTVCGAPASAPATQRLSAFAAASDAEQKCAGYRILGGSVRSIVLVSAPGQTSNPQDLKTIPADTSGTFASGIQMTVAAGGATAGSNATATQTITTSGAAGVAVTGTTTGEYDVSFADPEHPAAALANAQGVTSFSVEVLAPHSYALSLTPVFSNPSHAVRTTARIVQGGSILQELTAGGQLSGVLQPGTYTIISACAGTTRSGPGDMSCSFSFTLTAQPQ